MPGIDECLMEAMVLPGARGAAVIEWTSGLALGTAGDAPNGDHEVTAAEMAELARLAAEHTAFGSAEDDGADGGEAGTGAGPVPVEDLLLTTRTGYHLLRFVENTLDDSVFVYLWLGRDEGNLALARLRLRDLVERLALV
ncbi:hypothetical protein KBZ10_22920 [Streptomyces sp. F63]|uniref:hypothetical protein n=1 Tax=Streptomyces sp. F63 TaxID=2824887 RepID=UPI001B385541|nr:hypothetical protein [Streptomyces sp. F63]MBQ0987318.1 hypothetical protein [Streptomyces sp. F63]